MDVDIQYMNRQELILNWIKALRSGKYERGICRLRPRYNRFCCLGVLCDIYDNTKWILHNNQFYYVLDGSFDKNGWKQSKIPEKICLVLNIDNKNIHKLIEMNDKDAASFDEIADYIEENIL